MFSWKHFILYWIVISIVLMIIGGAIWLISPVFQSIGLFLTDKPVLVVILLILAISGATAYIASLGIQERPPSPDMQKKAELLFRIEDEKKRLTAEISKLGDTSIEPNKTKLDIMSARLEQLDSALYDIRHWKVR